MLNGDCLKTPQHYSLFLSHNKSCFETWYLLLFDCLSVVVVPFGAALGGRIFNSYSGQMKRKVRLSVDLYHYTVLKHCTTAEILTLHSLRWSDKVARF